MAHTPGPWSWLNYPDGRKLLVAPSRAVIHCPDAAMTVEPADGDLLAAAPDLLTALEAWADWASTLESMRDAGDPLTKEVRRVHGARIDATRAAITKARGETTGKALR